MTASGAAEVPWLATPTGALALSQLVLVWMLVMYVTISNRPLLPRGADTARKPTHLDNVGVIVIGRATLMLVGVCALFRPATFGAIAGTVAVSIAAAAVTWARAWLAQAKLGHDIAIGPKFAAELEILATSLFVGVAARTIEHTHASIAPLLLLPLSETRLAIIATTAGTYLFAAYGGAHIVRGVLEKATVLPRIARTPLSTPAADASPETVAAAQPLDTLEYNRGRLIGMIERVMLLTLVAAGSYEALGFITAAKGLIRSRDLENRAFAEYFLIGTLTSVALTLPLGLLVRAAIRHW